MRLLISCIDGLAWPLEKPPPFLAACLDQSAMGSLAGFSNPNDAWLLDGGPFWTKLSEAEVNLGIMNLPGLWPAQNAKGFMVCREPGDRAEGNWTHPPELADGLGGYMQPVALPSSAPYWRAPLKDTAFAEAAALARLRYEHFRRLCTERLPDVGALGWSALASARRLFGHEAGRADLMLNQLYAYIAWLRDEFQPKALVLIGSGWADQPGIIILLAPGQVSPGRLSGADWPDVLPALMDLAGLPMSKPARLLDGSMLSGEILP